MIIVSPYSIRIAPGSSCSRDRLRRRSPFNIVKHGKGLTWRVPWIARRHSSPTQLAGTFSAKPNESP